MTRHDTPDQEDPRHESGFSTLEALVSLALFLALMTAAMTVYAPSRLIYNRSERRVEVQQNARLAMGEMARQIRMAGFFPENFSGSPPSPQLADPVRIATDAALAIYGDADGSGASNVFLFCLDGTVLRRGRAAVGASGAYTCSSGEILAENVIGLEFTYYDVNGNPMPSPPAAPFQLDSQNIGSTPDMTDVTQRGSIRRVVLTVTAEAEAAHRGPQTYTLSSDIWLRNSG